MSTNPYIKKTATSKDKIKKPIFKEVVYLDSKNKELNKAMKDECHVYNDGYYTSADVKILFGDVVIDDIRLINFNLTEQVEPIYGYASYTFDKMSRGNRIVSGYFDINFKESHYIHAVTDRIGKKRAAGKGLSTKNKINDFKEPKTLKQLLNASSRGAYQSAVDKLEEAFWGKGTITNQIAARENRTFFYQEGTERGNLKESGYDIVLNYGKIEAPGLPSPKGTIKVIKNVHLYSVETLVDTTGEELFERYQFIARDLDGPLHK